LDDASLMNEIVRCPKIVFLGAGASRPLGKMLMGEFVEDLLKKADCPAPALLNAICKRNPDLEFLIGQLQEISDKGYLADTEQKLRGDGLMYYTIPAVSPEFATLATDAIKLLAWVRRQVYEHYRNLEDPGKTFLLHELLLRVMVAPGFTVVFTTNYDPSVEEMCRKNGCHIIDGFKNNIARREYVWDRSVFETFTRSGNETVVLFKIHGSTDWVKHSGRIVRTVPSSFEPGTGYESMMIYPAQSKVANDEPFFTGYDYLQRCLSNAEFCLVVGYSFRDYDTVMRFRIAARTNRKLRIAVLDPNAQKLCRNLREFGVKAEPIVYSFGFNEGAYHAVIRDVLNRTD
jgi:hypothetical protein